MGAPSRVHTPRRSSTRPPEPRRRETRRASLRICLLTNQDLLADPFWEGDWPCDPRPFAPEAAWTVEYVERKSSVAQVERRIAEGFDLFFNLCDGSAAQDEWPGLEVVQTLEAHGVPFTGATSTFFEPSRAEMKAACDVVGIDTPAWVLARTDADIDRAARTLRFPLFVKHYTSYASVGLTRRSKVATPAGLRQQARKMIRRYGAALVEEFIDGDEYTVLVAEDPESPDTPRTYRPIRYRFPEGESFKHESMKWDDSDQLVAEPMDDGPLSELLRDVSARFFVALGGTGFGRCDIRVDRTGRPFMLEINANCGIYYPPASAGGADLCLLHDEDGHRGFTDRLIAAAFARHRRSASR